MTSCNAWNDEATRRVRLAARATAFAVAFAVSLPQLARADNVTPPPVPADLQVEAGNRAFLEGHGVGTQNYMCLPAGSGFAWTLLTPQATLFSDDDKQVTTHFFSPSRFENGAIRATWEHSRDSSTVQAALVKPSTDPAFVAAGAIPWLLLKAVKGAQQGPTGGDTLTPTTFVQRLNTAGGVAPADGCAASTDVGARAFVPYTADYYFYSRDDGN
jgi:hypothetical protein